VGRSSLAELACRPPSSSRCSLFPCRRRRKVGGRRRRPPVNLSSACGVLPPADRGFGRSFARKTRPWRISDDVAHLRHRRRGACPPTTHISDTDDVAPVRRQLTSPTPTTRIRQSVLDSLCSGDKRRRWRRLAVCVNSLSGSLLSPAASTAPQRRYILL